MATISFDIEVAGFPWEEVDEITRGYLLNRARSPEDREAARLLRETENEHGRSFPRFVLARSRANRDAVAGLPLSPEAQARHAERVAEILRAALRGLQQGSGAAPEELDFGIVLVAGALGYTLEAMAVDDAEIAAAYALATAHGRRALDAMPGSRRLRALQMPTMACGNWLLPHDRAAGLAGIDEAWRLCELADELSGRNLSTAGNSWDVMHLIALYCDDDAIARAWRSCGSTFPASARRVPGLSRTPLSLR